MIFNFLHGIKICEIKFYFLISEFRIALVQLAVTSNKAQNLLRAKDKIKEAASNGAKIVALPVGFAWFLEDFISH